MDNILENFIMFFGSSTGLTLIWIFIYTIYIIRREKNYIYILWLLIPIVPVIHFFINKKSKKIWGIFILIMLLDILFAYFLEPDIVNKKINVVSFNINEVQYVITQKEQLKLINDIKWDIYKTQLLNNLGLRVVNDGYQGDLIISHNRSKSTYYDYPLKNILKLIKN